MKKSLMVALGALHGRQRRALAQEEAVVNVYNWSDYIAEDTIAKFEAETGIKVNYDVFDSNELVEAKLLAGNSGYDVVVPSGFFLERQVAAGLFLPLDKAKLPNLANMDPDVMAATAAHDPDNAHAVDYMWVTTGIGYNVAKVTERLGDTPVDSWDLVFKPEVVGQARRLRRRPCSTRRPRSWPRALNYLGLDPNSESAEDLAKAEDAADVGPARTSATSTRASTSTISATAKSASRSATRATCSSPPSRGRRSRCRRRDRLRHPQGRRAHVVRPVRHPGRCAAPGQRPQVHRLHAAARTSRRRSPTTCSTPARNQGGARVRRR